MLLSYQNKQLTEGIQIMQAYDTVIKCLQKHTKESVRKELEARYYRLNQIKGLRNFSGTLIAQDEHGRLTRHFPNGNSVLVEEIYPGEKLFVCRVNVPQQQVPEKRLSF